MSEINPFNVAYLTEANYGPGELLARYSFLPFRHVQDKLSSVANVFLIGRRGTGKTMLLKLFEPEIMKLLYTSDEPEHAEVRRLLPGAVVGAYFNIGSAAARLHQFQGHGKTADWWRRAYADYVNWSVLQTSLRALEVMTSIPRWCEAAELNETAFWESEAFGSRLASALREETSAFDAVTDIAGVKGVVSARLRHWQRFVNSDPMALEPPHTPLLLGTPLFGLVKAIRDTGVFGKAFRLFLLVDQYEHLYETRHITDHRPMFNQAMYISARGGTGVEFKIGTRQYALGSLQLLDGAGRLESREKTEVALDELGRGYFRPFALDIFRKRLESTGVRRSDHQASRLAARYLPSLGAREEAAMYAREGSDLEPKYLSPFIQRWGDLGMRGEDTALIVRRSGLESAHPLTGALACIALTRWMRDGAAGAPVGCEETKKTKQLSARAGGYLAELVERIELRYTGRKDRRPWYRAVDNFVRDAEHAALFQLASAYKNQRRYYTGVDSIIRVSSSVAIVFLEIMRSCYELLLLEGMDPGSDPVPPSIQSQAVYRVSEAWFNRIPLECDYGQTLQEFLRATGLNFRKVQLELTAPDPAPNGFSITAGSRGEPDSQEGDPRTDPKRVLFESVSWGLFEEFWHQDKNRAHGKRSKFLLNRVYCPYFGLSDLTKKDPMYISDVTKFITTLLQGDEPEEFTRRLQRSRGQGNRKVDQEQTGLFAG